ncbi:MAG: PD-(D/E)XK nuclease family protein [Planktomarina sp.]
MTQTPLYYVPLGVPFAPALVHGLKMRFANPAQMARTQLYVNTRRMQRSVADLFMAGDVSLLPQMNLVGDVPYFGAATTISPLAMQLQLADLIRPLLALETDMGPQATALDYAQSLASLMDEMAIEDVSTADIAGLSVTDEAGHWQRVLGFLQIAKPFLEASGDISPAMKQRLGTNALVQNWTDQPPNHPVVIAGSTGSRKTTFDLMMSAAKLPQGMIVLPGFDPSSPWQALTSKSAREDHPQYRFAALMDALDIAPGDVEPWTTDVPSAPKRNTLVSLALQPAPVTDTWMTEGPKLANDLEDACADITWLNAPDERTEAETIALRLCAALADGQTAAVITPNRNLTRRIASNLAGWGIVPDDSAGLPLLQSPPGRFLLHAADVMQGGVDLPTLLIFLKHPLCHAGPNRNNHQRHTRDFEIYCRRKGIAHPTEGDLTLWADDKDDRLIWVKWVQGALNTDMPDSQDLATWTVALIDFATTFGTGLDTDKTELWEMEAGRACRAALDKISQASDATGGVVFEDFKRLLRQVLNDGEVRQQNDPHRNIQFFGTLEARMQAADLVILAGLNEGTWPDLPAPDPWMNRRMRKGVGLLNPDRRIGLSAHDFQQAFANAEVWVTRSLRSADAQTVPSRWLNRLSNLINGLSEDDEHPVMTDMVARGDKWMRTAVSLRAFTPRPKAPRPSVAPPAALRPKKLPVTAITTLIRDPYAIYAKYVLDLHPLDPLLAEPDALRKGIVIHKVFEEFAECPPFETHKDGVAQLLSVARDVLEVEVPWQIERMVWMALIEKIAPQFIKLELNWQKGRLDILTETEGTAFLPEIDFTLTAKADRIDVHEGALHIFDYKTGNAPSIDKQKAFEKQMSLQIAMAMRGAFGGDGDVSHVTGTYLSLKKDVKTGEVLDPVEHDTWAKLITLIANYQKDETGFTARRAAENTKFAGDYDHLSRYGEWSTADDAHWEALK